MNNYLCRIWNNGDEFETVEANSMFEASEYFVRRGSLFYESLKWKEVNVTVEVIDAQPNHEYWIVNVRVEPTYQYRSTNRRKLEDL